MCEQVRRLVLVRAASRNSSLLSQTCAAFFPQISEKDLYVGI